MWWWDCSHVCGVGRNSRVRVLLSGWLGIRGLPVSSRGPEPGRGGGTGRSKGVCN